MNTEETIAIIIPTYNAAPVVLDTLQRIRSVTRKAKLFIVDDNSPDKTPKYIKAAFKNDKNIEIIIRDKKDGRGSAIMTGFKKAILNPQIKYFIEMDADLCHDPKYIPNLVAVCNGVDVVITSRYLAKSKIDGWNLRRKTISKSINILAQVMLKIPITDYSNGYRCYSRKAVECIIQYNLASKGFIVLSEMAYICYKNNLIIKEIPFHFNHIALSKSNLNIGEMKESLLTLFKLRIINIHKL